MVDAYDRIRETRRLLPDFVPVQVDGGIGPENVAAVRDAGARLFVAGASIFSGDDIVGEYRRLLDALS
jgi:ribulose-phosphate 3-epimerase